MAGASWEGAGGISHAEHGRFHELVGSIGTKVDNNRCGGWEVAPP